MAGRTGAVRPVQVSRSKELGHTISIDPWHWKRNRDGREATVVDIIDEASRFHVAENLTAMDHIEAVRMNWFRFARRQLSSAWTRKVLSNLMSFESGRGIEVQMAAGEAHWRIGIVETHIRLLKNELCLMEDELPDASIDELVEHCVAAKVRRQTFDGHSP